MPRRLGCARLRNEILPILSRDPAALAAWVLRNEPAWNPERILAAMSGSTSVRVDFNEPIQVILFYVTAVVMPEDGRIHFAEDIYHHDSRLDSALEAARPPR